MGGINYHTLCIVGVILGNGGAFVLGMGDAVVDEQIVTFAQPVCLMCWSRAFFCCLQCSRGLGGMML
jgi:hypothetical protein